MWAYPRRQGNGGHPHPGWGCVTVTGGRGLSPAPSGVSSVGSPGTTRRMEIRISSWTELHEQVFAELVARGLGFSVPTSRSEVRRLGADLNSALARLAGDAETRERHLGRNFREYAARDAVPVDPRGGLSSWLARHDRPR
jgi:hypothetical protein